MSGYFITGTDTDVGKTFVLRALMSALQQRGLRVAPMKPVAAGTVNADRSDVNEDVVHMMRESANRFPLHAVNPYCFRDAIAPHIAAHREGVTVDINVIQAAYRALAANADIVLVEGAGGFLVPLSGNDSMALIPAALQLPVILVVDMRLGCINHALLTVEAIATRKLTLAGWVANTSGDPMNAYLENLSALKNAIAAPLLGEIPCLPHGGPAAASVLLNIDQLISAWDNSP